MSKNVVVIASGETERRSLRHLLAHLQTEDLFLVEVRITPGNKALSVNMAERLIKALWFERINNPPDKFVLLVDTDGKSPKDVLSPYREQLPQRLGPNISPQIQFASAQWHLEAWYFADVAGLRSYLERAPGSVDASKPDEISNPKTSPQASVRRSRLYAVISEEIAKKLNARTIAQRSPSFHRFLDAVRNGVS